MKYLLVKSLFIISSIFILIKSTTFAQSISITDGKWEDGTTWQAGSVPTGGSDVIIRHAVVIDAATPDVNISDINSITITNTQPNNSYLEVTGGKSLYVKSNVTITATDADYDANFNIHGISTNVEIAGDLIATDNNTFLKSLIISVDNTAELHVLSNFTFTKNQNFRPPVAGVDSETFVEIEMGKTPGSQPIFTVGGSTRMLYDMDDPGYFRFRLDNDSYFGTTNLLLRSDKSGFPDSLNVDLAVEMLGTSKIEVFGTTTLEFNYDGVNTDHENLIYAKENSFFYTNNLSMISNSSTSTFNNMLRSYGSAIIEIETNASFVRNTYVSDNRIATYHDSRLILKGTMTNSNSFTWQFLNNSTFELSGSVVQTLPDPVSNTYQNLTINNTSGTPLTLPDDASVYDLLTLTSGIINTTSTELLTIEDGGSSTVGSILSHIDGPMSKVGSTNFEFPVGDNNFWQPISVSNISVSTTFTAEYFEATPVNNLVLKSPDPNGDLENISGFEYWELTNSSPTSADVTLHWKDKVRSDITSPADLRVAHYTGSEWENLGNASFTATDPTGSVTATNITTFSPFTFGSFANNALPVTLASFSAKQQDLAIEIEWVTTSEENNNFFELQKSTDGTQFESIATINSRNQGSHYSYADFQPINGSQYYRLKQVDFDGSFEYSKVIMVIYTGNTLSQPYLFPNPVSGNSINLIIPDQEKLLAINLLDKIGKKIRIEYKSTSLNQFLLFVPNLQKGVYIVQIETDQRTYSEKIIRE